MPEDTDEWPDDFDLQSEAVKDCAERVFEENPDLSKSQAFAICQDMENEGQLQAREAAGPTQPIHALADAPMDPPGPIERRDTDEGIRYTNILILAPGEWTDGATGEAMFYSPELTEHIASDPRERVPERNGRVQNIVNFDHNKGEQLAEIGHFEVDSLTRDEHGNLYADIVLWNDTTASQDAVALMDRALKTDGQQGAGGFSVEIPFENEVTEFDRDRGLEKMVAGDLAGLAIARESASAPAATAQQFADRATALSGGDDPSHTYATLTARSGHGSDMAATDPITDLDDLRERDTSDHHLNAVLTADGDTDHLLVGPEDDEVSIEIEGASIEDIRDALTHLPDGDSTDDTDLDDDPDPEHDLADEGMVASVVDDYLANAGSPEDGVDALVQWARENTDVDMDALEAAAADYLAQTDAEDLSETPVGEFMAFLEEQAGGEEGEDEEEEEDDSEMAEELAAMREEMRELKDTNEDLRERVETLESKPEQPRSLAAHAEGGEDDGPRGPSRGGLSRDGDFIGR